MHTQENMSGQRLVKNPGIMYTQENMRWQRLVQNPSIMYTQEIMRWQRLMPSSICSSTTTRGLASGRLSGRRPLVLAKMVRFHPPRKLPCPWLLTIETSSEGIFETPSSAASSATQTQENAKMQVTVDHPPPSVPKRVVAIAAG